MRIAACGSLSLRLWAVVLVALIAGCALGPRAKAVFVQQHRASTALTEAILAAEMEEPALAERLYGTEDELNAACGPLQTAGYRRMTEEAVDPALNWAAFTTLQGCAVKTEEVERLLWQVDPETAQYFLTKPTIVSVIARD